MFDYIKDLRRRYLLRQLRKAPREKKIVNMEHVKSIGIVFALSNENDWNLLYHFAQLMEKQGKTVHMIGLQPANANINFIITHTHTTLCHEKEDINFWGIPKDEVLSNFNNIHYDVLVDTTDEPNFFGQYVALRTIADLKVTYTDEVEATHDENIFDMMIEGEGALNMRDYLNQVVHYLNMVNK